MPRGEQKSERNKREVLLSNHMDKMDARLLVKKARVCFSLVPPASNVKWQDDELYCCRWWEPQQNKVFALDDPGLKVPYNPVWHVHALPGNDPAVLDPWLWEFSGLDSSEY
jgi:hypothetical protein